MNNLFRIILCISLLCPLITWSQNLIEGEYFYNSDPGQGNGISFTLPNGVDVSQTLLLSTVGLNEGFHQVGIRVKRDDGMWSHYWQQSLFISNPQSNQAINFPNLVEGEYFFGPDPGQGNGISFLTPTGIDVSLTLNLSTVNLNPGFHQVGIRVKRQDGQWSHYWQQAVFINDPTTASTTFPDLVEGEYFFGPDPGQGNGISFLTPVGDDISQNLNVSTANLTPGFHQLAIRVKRQDGRWSHYWQQAVYINDPTTTSTTFPDLIEGEYFFGPDPGQGNGISFLTPVGDDISQNLNVSTANLTPGFHQLAIRVKRQDGRWSHYWQQAVFINDPTTTSTTFPDLVEGEYFFGPDPGQGNGISFLTPVGDDISQNLNVSTANLTPGFHQLAIRVKRQDGRWSHYWQQAVYINDPTTTSTTFPDLIEGEYFFGPDPGQGNGISFLTPVGDDISQNLNVSTANLTPGFHQLAIRVKRQDGRWSHYWQQAVYINDPISASTTFPDLVEGEYFFGPDPGQGNGTSFSFSAGSDINEVVSVSTASLSPGTHHLAVRVKRADGRWSHFWRQTVVIPSCLLTGTDVITSCGPYTWIDGNTYTQSNFVATHLIPIAGCDSLVTLNLTVDQNSTAPTSINQIGSFCVGGSTSLERVGGSLSNGAQWEWFADNCGTTVIGNGNSIQVSPSVNTNYFVRASSGNSCPPSSCISINVAMPIAGTNLSVDGEEATCFVNQNGWVHFYNTNGNLIASINSNGQDLGEVEITSFVNASPYLTASCIEPTNPVFFQTSLQRSFVVNPQFQPTNPVQIRLYVLDSEVTAYQNSALTTSQNPQDDITGIIDLNLTKISNGAGSGNPLDICNSNASVSYLLQDSSGDINTLNFNGFSATSYLEFTVDGFSEFFPMTSGNNNSPLPVELISFAANCIGEQFNGNQVQISWITASELNASYYLLQSSRDGSNWVQIAQVEATGTTNQISNYSLMDQSSGGWVYYRLLQVDNDGKIEIFGPISSKCDFENNKLTVHPNPASETFSVRIQSIEEITDAVLELVDMSGRVIVSQINDLISGMTLFNLNIQDLEPGTYIIRVNGENDKFTPVRVVKI